MRQFYTFKTKLLASILLLCSVLAFSKMDAALSGTYTVDPSSAASATNYKNLASVVGDLTSGTRTDGGTANGSGVSGAVKILIYNGTYTEQFELTAISGASNSKRVRFMSNSGDSSKVIINWAADNSNSSADYAVQLNGASYITFANLTIQRLGTSSHTYSTAVSLLEGCTYDSFTKCIIRGNNNYPYANTITFGDQNASALEDNCVFNENHITKGGYGIYASGDPYGYNTGAYGYKNSILKNTFDSLGQYSIYVFGEDGMKIDQNKINHATGAAIYLNYFENSISNNYASISGNYIKTTGTGCIGIADYYASFGSYNSVTSLFSNNMIISAGPGIQNYYSNYRNYYHNNVNTTGNNPAFDGYYGGYSGSYNIKNNVFTSTGGGYAVDFYYASGAVTSCNYNNLRTSGTNIARYSYATYTTFASYKSASGFDANSKNVDPLYTSSTSDLHVANPALNGTGTNVSITKDFDGETRGSTPDIGADEFTPVALDASISSIAEPSGAYCSGTTNIKVVLANLGTTTLTSDSIAYSINGVPQTGYSWTGTLTSGSSTTVTIGSYAFTSGTYTLVARSYIPNGGTDGNGTNDSSVKTLYKGLQGNYTLGGTTPNFTSFQMAIDSAKLKGLCGRVVINVRDGSYNEQIDVKDIPTTSTNVLVFQSQSNDSSKARLYYSASASYSPTTDYLIKYTNNQKYVHFKSLTLERPGTSSQPYANVIFLNGSSNDSIANCIIRGNKNYATNGFAINNDPNSADINLVFSNNKIVQSAYGFYFYNYSTETGNKFLGNYIDSISYYPAYFYYQDDITISNNRITGKYLYGGALYVSYSNTGLTINGNLIKATAGPGMYLQSINNGGTPTNAARVFNNMIISNGTYAAQLYYARYTFYYYNTFSTLTSSSTVYYYDYSTPFVTFKNNIFSNTGGGYAFEYNYTSGLPTMNYNNYYFTGTNLGYYNYSTYSTLSAWKSALGAEANAKNVNPGFYSNTIASTNLHSVSSGLNGAAQVISGYTTDYDGETRNVSTPDIGADEFTLPANDASISSIISPNTVYCGTGTPVVANLGNFGTNTLTSVSLNVKINGVAQTPVSWTGSIGTGTTVSVSFGSYAFNRGDAIKVYPSSPNGATDGQASNDTSAVSGLSKGFSGTYTLGSGGYFSTFTQAADSFALKGVCGNVIVNVFDGSYNERATINPIPGVSASNTVTFQSNSLDSTKVRIYTASGSGSNWCVKFNGAKYITFNKMTISRTNVSFSGSARAVDFSGGACFNTVKNCIVKTNNLDASGTAFFSDATSTDSGNTIQNNIIRYPNFGVNFSGSAYETGNRFLYNKFDSIANTGISAQYQEQVKVIGNTINMTSANTYGMNFQYMTKNSEFSYNKVTMNNGGYGMYLYYVNFPLSSPTGTVKVFNNMVSVLSPSNTSDYGIYLGYGSHYDLVYNNVRMGSSSTSAYAAYLYYYNYNASSYPQRVQNNNFVCMNGAVPAFEYYAQAATWNYNNLYTTGSTIGTRYYSTNYSTFASWQATGLDANGKNVNPSYASTTDLHVSASALNGTAQAISGYTKDFDGETRNATTPDIGADEFTPPYNDAAITAIAEPTSYCGGSTTIKAVLKNNGLSTITSASIRSYVSGSVVGTYSWTGTLASGASTTVSTGSYTFTSGSYIVAAKVTQMNSIVDSVPLNDSASSLPINSGMGGVYTIGTASGHNYSTLSAAAADVTAKGICSSIIFKISKGSYNEQVKIPSTWNTSQTKTVTFQSRGLNPDSVNVNYIGSYSSANNHVVVMDGAKYVNFKYVTLDRTSNYYYITSYRTTNGAHHDSLINCKLKAYKSPSYAYTGNYYSDNANDSANYLGNTTIKGGYYGVYINGSYSVSPARKFTMENCLVDSVYNYDLYLYGTNNTLFKGNTFNPILYAYSYQNYILYCGGTNFLNNKINVTNGYYGVYMYYENYYYVPSVNSQWSNNMINVVGGSSYGFYGNYNNNLDFYYNSFNTTSSGYAFYTYGGSLGNIKNNIFSNKAGGYALQLQYCYPSSINYNDYYTTSSNFGQYNYTNASTLSSWQSSTGGDNNSLVSDPTFNSGTDLHTTSISLNGAGTPITGITKDIDGDTRNASTPDIGADEFSLPANNASISSIVSPLSYCGGSTSIIVALKNAGTTTMTSASIRWYVSSSLQGTYAWTGTLSAGSSANITVGSYSFTSGTYSVQARSFLPNGVFDSVPANDSAFQNNINSGFKGVKTIGSGGGYDYSTIQGAVNAVTTAGVCGNTWFHIADGTYNEQVKIQSIPGTSSSATVTFVSANKDSSKVRVNYNINNTYNFNANYVFWLDGAKYVNLDSITISRGGSGSYVYNGNVVYLGNGANNIKIHANRIENPYGTYFYYGGDLVTSNNGYSYSGGNAAHNITVSNNSMRGGMSAIYPYGPSSSNQNRNWIIRNNKIDSFYNYGVYPVNASNITISRNRIVGTTTYGAYPIYLNTCDSMISIDRNYVKLSTTGYGMYLYYVNYNGSTVSTSGLIQNNMVISGSNAYFGLYDFYNKKLKYANNSFSFASSSNFAVYMYGTYNGYFINNIVSAPSGGGFIATDYTYPDSINANNYYGTGSYRRNYGSPISTLSAWTTASGYDGASLTLNPNFVNPTSDLHITQTGLDGKGRNAGLTIDYDGDVRTSPYDIGADEFTPSPYDVAVASIDSPTSYCGGTQNIKATISNLGTVTLTSTSMRMYVNGSLQSTSLISGLSLAPGSSISKVIGTYNFTSGTYFVQARAFAPNSNVDGNLLNDSAFSTPIKNGMSGTYTVATTGTPNYSTVQSAIDDVRARGLCGNVIIQLADEIFVGQVKIGNVGTSASRTLTIQGNLLDSSKSGIQYNSSSNYSAPNYVIKLDTSKYVTIRNLTIRRSNNGSGYYCNTIELANQATNNTIKNCLIKGNYNYPYNYGMIVTNNMAGNINLNIKRNQFCYSFAQIQGTGTSSNAVGFNLDSNNVDSFYYGLYLNYCSNFNIRNNNFRNPSSGAQFAAQLQYCGDVNTGNVTTISGNKFDLGNTGYAMQLYYNQFGGTYVQNQRIYNNFFSQSGSSATAGIYIYYNGRTDIYNNSFNMVSTNASSAPLYVYYANSSGKIKVYNNTMRATSGYAFYTGATSYVDSMNYNNLYVTGSNIAYAGTSYSTFVAYKSGTGFDANGKNVDPSYTAVNDLHTTASSLNGSAKVIPYITVDIDGQTRNVSTPDIGADEFNPPSIDAATIGFKSPSLGNTCAGSNPVKIILQNAGLTTLTSASLGWSINGVAQTPYAWTGSLNSGDTVSVLLGSHSFVSGFTYNFKSWSSVPNSIADPNVANDTTFLNNFGSSLSGTMTIGGTSPNYTTFALAVADLNTYGICGPVVFNVRDGAYNEQISINQIVGSSSVNTITFQSENLDSSKVTLYYNTQSFSSNYVVLLNGADYVTFQKMTLSAVSSGSFYNSVFRFENNANNNILKNNRIWGKRNATYTGYYAATIGSFNQTYTSSDNDTNNLITNNDIRGGGYGIYLQGYYSPYERSGSITNNVMDSMFYQAISATYSNKLVISRNTIKMPNAYSTGFSGIYITNSYITAVGDKIQIDNNIVTSTKTGAYGYGIYPYYTYSFSPSYGRINIVNNMVSMAGTSGASYGIYCNYTPYTTYANNNMYVNSTSSRAFYTSYTFSNNRLFNNNFVNNTTGMPFEITSGYGSSFDSSTNNNFKSAGTNVAIWNGTSYTSISALQTGSSSNANSYNVSPGYTSSSDLHQSTCALKDKGRFILLANPDIDGQTRGAIQDIGADEFIGAPGTWVGTYDSLWSNTANWCSNTLPTSTNDMAFVPSPTYLPIVNGTSPNALIRDLSIGTGQSVKVKGGKLSIYGDLVVTSPGVFTNTSGTVNYNKSTVQAVRPMRYNHLELNAGPKSLAGNLTTDSGLTISSSSSIPVGANTVKLNGFITGSDSLKTTASSKIYVGGYAAAQLALKTSTRILSVLKLNRERGAKIDGGNLRVVDSLILTAGHLATNSAPVNDTVSATTTATKIDESAGWYVVGCLRTAPRTLTLSVAIPSQNGLIFTRNTSTNPGNVTVTRIMGNDASFFNAYPLIHGSLTYLRSSQMWDIQATGAITGLNITTEFHYSDSFFALNGRDETILNLYSRTGSATQYSYEGRVSINPSTNVLTEGVTHFSEWMLGGGSNPLPVEWLGFNATLSSPTSTNLTWSTAMEENNERFDVERSEDGINYTKVGEKAGNGTVFTVSNYGFVDRFSASITAPTLYYRLKQIDFNGKFDYSDIRKVNLTSKLDEIKAYFDNGTKKAIITIASSSDKQLNIRVTDAAGKELINNSIRATKGYNRSEIDMNIYAKGIYNIFISDANGNPQVLRVMKF